MSGLVNYSDDDSSSSGDEQPEGTYTNTLFFFKEK